MYHITPEERGCPSGLWLPPAWAEAYRALDKQWKRDNLVYAYRRLAQGKKVQQVKHITDWMVLQYAEESPCEIEDWPGGIWVTCPRSYSILVSVGWNEKVVYAKIEQMDRRGLTDWGTSLKRFWLEPKGVELYMNLREENR